MGGAELEKCVYKGNCRDFPIEKTVSGRSCWSDLNWNDLNTDDRPLQLSTTTTHCYINSDRSLQPPLSSPSSSPSPSKHQPPTNHLHHLTSCCCFGYNHIHSLPLELHIHSLHDRSLPFWPADKLRSDHNFHSQRHFWKDVCFIFTLLPTSPKLHPSTLPSPS